MSNISFITAFLFGLLAFFSPCTFPLIPSFIAYIGGISSTSESSLVLTFPVTYYAKICAYLLGSSCTLVLLGISVGSFGYFFRSNRFLIQQLGGILVILFALQVLNIFKLSLFTKGKEMRKALNFLHQFHKEKKIIGIVGAFLIGVIFTIGWIPCLSLILGSILTLAAGTNPLYGGILLFIYAIGQLLPLLVFAIFYEKINNVFLYTRKFTFLIPRISGICMLIMGLFLLLNQYTVFTQAFYTLAEILRF